MPSDSLKSILEFLKLAPRYLIAVALVTGSMLFLPIEFVEVLGLQELVNSYRSWLGLAFVTSTVLWGLAIINDISRWIRRKNAQRKNKNFIIEKLHSLNEDEKQILRYYFVNGTRANMLRIDDGIVQELAAYQIIFRSADMGDMLQGFAHNISDFAWDYIHKNPHVLEGTTNTYRSDRWERW